MTFAQRRTYWSYRAAGALIQRLPPGVSLQLARAAGNLAGRLSPRRRALVTRHQARVYAKRDLALPCDAASKAFASYARYWMEAFRLPSVSLDEIAGTMTADGVDHLRASQAAGKGTILALPHVGNWDWGGAWLTQEFPLTVLVERLEPPELFEWFTQFRKSIGMRVIPYGADAGPVLLRALRANETVCLVCDRDLEASGIEVEFFGERTTFPAGPATLALRTGAALLATVVYFENDGGHRGIITEPLEVRRSGESLRVDIARTTQALAVRFEELIAREPEQWHLFQPNWPSDRTDVL